MKSEKPQEVLYQVVFQEYEGGPTYLSQKLYANKWEYAEDIGNEDNIVLGLVNPVFIEAGKVKRKSP